MQGDSRIAEQGEGAGMPLSAMPAEASTTAATAMADEEHYCFTARYAKTQLEVRLAISDCVQDLKAILFSMTDVPPERQKILGLVRGKLPDDDTPLGQLTFLPASLRDSPHPVTGEKRITISLVGTPLDQTFKDPEVEQAKATKADGSGGPSDVDYSDPSVIGQLEIEPRKDPHAIEKLQRAISRFSLTFPVMQEPRQGLKGGLLVLDLDYTMADTKRLFKYHVTAREAERPGLHEMLAAVYPYYDICVWSQTSHWWLEAKLTELGCLTNDKYRIAFVLDRTPMFSVRCTPKNDVSSSSVPSSSSRRKQKHEVKALEIIWRRFSGTYGPHNTIHIDDLARNFAMNPTNGLKIKPYKHSPKPDEEFSALRDYLLKLAHSGVKDFTALGGHKAWKAVDLPSVKEEEDEQPQ